MTQVGNSQKHECVSRFSKLLKYDFQPHHCFKKDGKPAILSNDRGVILGGFYEILSKYIKEQYLFRWSVSIRDSTALATISTCALVAPAHVKR